MSNPLIATHCVVCLVDGQVRTFQRDDPLPELPDDEADRLVKLGAARPPVAEAHAAAGGGKAKSTKSAKAAAAEAAAAEAAAAEAAAAEAAAAEAAAAEAAAAAAKGGTPAGT